MAANVDDDLVMMDADQGVYFSLNPVGAAIWALLETPKTYDDLISGLLSQYEVTRETCEQDVQPFLSELVDNGLVMLGG